MRVSVVISTLHRAESLRLTLAALRFQTHEDFEVIVVEGPSEVGWGRRASDQHSWVRRVSCPQENLARSRNLGIADASGDVVAFIDDDAVPDPRWLEQLAGAYEEEDVTGAGGKVLDATGMRPQYEYALCDRLGRPRFDSRPPFSRQTLRGADPFLYLQGTNMSFRRDALVAIGGFDEQLVYLYDDADVCLRMLDAGARLSPLAHAAVHHRSLASPVRREDGLIYDPLVVAQGRAYFAYRHGPSSDAAERSLLPFAQELRQGALAARAAGRFTAAELEHFNTQLHAGLEHGRECALEGPRHDVLATEELGLNERTRPSADGFLCYPRAARPERPARVCLLAPVSGAAGQNGGQANATLLARRLAGQGHEVHLLRASSRPSAVEFGGDVWTHAVEVQDRALASLAGVALEHELYAAAAYYHEVQRLHEQCRLDAVLVPRSGCEGVICSLDGRFATGTQLPSTHERADGGGEPVRVEELAETLCRLAGIDLDGARQSAAELLDRTSYPFDLVAALLEVWAAPPERFVEEAFRAVLGREPDAHTRAVWEGHIDAGHSRHHLIADALGSAEARERGVQPETLFRFRRRFAAWAPVQLRLAWDLPDDEFIRAAYQWTLGRTPDAEHGAIAVDDLRNGVSRIDVVARLTESTEAREHGMLPGTIELVRAQLRSAWRRDSGPPALVEIQETACASAS